MRLIPFLISGVITTGLVIAGSKPWGSVPPMGSFLSPQHGFWQNAESVSQDYNLDLSFSQLKDKVSVYFDDKLIPHLFAQNDEDLYFVQGYLHAKFRLWQMEFQTHAAAGRLSEIIGPGPDSAVLNYDRNMRRLGMVYAAKNSLRVMENDPGTRSVLDSYTAGVNAFISNLSSSQLPIEYRLLNYSPEPWTNLKTALFLKYMSYDLAGSENDIEYTNAKSVIGKAMFDKLYPFQPDSLDPIVPKGTAFAAATEHPIVPAKADSAYFHWKDSVPITAIHKPDKRNGSNNWAVNGTKTRSGHPILCSDPHLGLNLPSLWYEMQLHTPQSNAYGVSFPGAPAIIIGFTDQIAWGVTNSSRDVKDYYAIRFKDESRKEYWFNGAWKNADLKIETYKIKGGEPVADTVAYTVFGPVQYDRSFTGAGRTHPDMDLAVRWKAHDGSNELKAFYLLNRATGYDDYLAAIKHFTCPGQNFVFAAKDNTIAIWQQGEYPAKWKRQGDFIMPGTDSSYMWQEWIPQAENPHLINPERGFVSSANQMPTDTTYPYYLGGHYDLYRGFNINRKLRGMFGITPDDMKQMQADNYNVLAEIAVPLLLRNIRVEGLSEEEKKYLEIMRAWNLRNDPAEKGVAVFNSWLDKLEAEVWSDEFAQVPQPYELPQIYTLVEGLLKDSAYPFIDNHNTPEKETLSDVVTTAFRKAVPALVKADQQGTLEWSRFKDSGIRHLLRLAPFSRYHLTTGGGKHIINATEQFHGPSWRMIVHLTDKTEAYGIYPGGQSGNPGSHYYETFIDQWAEGKYNRIWVMQEDEAKDKQVKFKMQFNK